MTRPTAQDIVDAWNRALYEIHHPKPPKAVCPCGSVTAVQGFGTARIGLYCGNGHYLPGQEMPRELVRHEDGD